MERPSASWDGLGSLTPSSDMYQRTTTLLSTADFEYLATRAIETRRKHQPDLLPDVKCSINQDQFSCGFNNVVLELAFSDGVYWVARIPHQPLDDEHSTCMLSEIATMKILKNQTTVPVPRIFAFELSTDQPFGYPYVLEECMPGAVLPTGVAEAVPPQHHGKVAKQLANVFMELQTLTFDRIGRLWRGEDAAQPVEIIPMAWHPTPGPLDTSLEYFYNKRREENREAMALHPHDPEWRTSCWVLKAALPSMVVGDRVRGPFPLCHLDLHFGNMQFDSDFNLTGIIDWSHAQAAPLEQLSVCPEFVAFPGRSDEENQPIVELKKLVVDALRELEASSSELTSGSTITPLSIYMASRSAEITHRYYMAGPRSSLFAGRMVAKLMYGDTITWEQLREVYGQVPLC